MGVTIEVRNLTKRYGNFVALNSVSLKIDSGEFLVLLGPSGCGKSTLLRCIAGLEIPDEGEILIDDKLVFCAKRGISVPPGNRQLGMVFQSYALWPHMTVNENIGFGLSIQKLAQSEITQRTEKVLKELSMEGLGGRYPSELSGGQQQRVALARLLATKPPIFFMDEPLSNLDARLRMDMRSELKRLHYETGATIVYVTHDQTEAMELASNLAVIVKGRIEQVAPPMQLYRHPATLYVADFVGLTPINLMSAKTKSDNGAGIAYIEDFEIALDWAPTSENIIVAIRPEDVVLDLEPAADAVEFEVYTVLTAGAELVVQAKRANTIVTICEPRWLELKIEQPIWVRFDPATINLYDKKSGKLLAPAETTMPENPQAPTLETDTPSPNHTDQSKEITS